MIILLYEILPSLLDFFTYPLYIVLNFSTSNLIYVAVHNLFSPLLPVIRVHAALTLRQWLWLHVLVSVIAPADNLSVDSMLLLLCSYIATTWLCTSLVITLAAYTFE